MIAPFASMSAATGERIVPSLAAGPLHPGHLPANALTVVLGAAGSGKTRLLSRIARDLAQEEAAARVIMVERHAAAVPSLRVFEALLLAHKQGDRWAVGTREIQAVRACLRQVGLAQAADGLVEQLDAEARQRLLIAHALIRQPDVLLMDQPERTLAPCHQADIALMLRRIAAEQGLRTVVAMADAATALRVADRLLLMRDGRLVATGSPAQLRALARAGDIDAAWLPS